MMYSIMPKRKQHPLYRSNINRKSARLMFCELTYFNIHYESTNDATLITDK